MSSRFLIKFYFIPCHSNIFHALPQTNISAKNFLKISPTFCKVDQNFHRVWDKFKFHSIVSKLNSAKKIFSKKIFLFRKVTAIATCVCWDYWKDFLERPFWELLEIENELMVQHTQVMRLELEINSTSTSPNYRFADHIKMSIKISRSFLMERLVQWLVSSHFSAYWKIMRENRLWNKNWGISRSLSHLEFDRAWRDKFMSINVCTWAVSDVHVNAKI